MSEQVEITGEASARAWLETQDHQTQVWFAARCAARGLPGTGFAPNATTSGLALAVFRAMLISTGAGTCPPADMRALRDAALSAHSAHSALSAADSATLSALSARSADSATLSAHSAAHSAALSATNTDRDHVGRWPALWPNQDMPQGLAQGWSLLRDQLAAEPKVWQFWIDWYEGLLTGTPMPWPLIYRLAREITDDEWDEGPATVAGRINDIKASYLSKQAPLAETIELDTDTGLFQVVPTPVQNSNFTSALLSRVQDSLEDALTGNNGLNDASRDVKTLTRMLQRYSNDPQRIEMDLTSVSVSLRRQIFQSVELPESAGNLALLEATEEGTRGIRANYPDVAANREQVAREGLKELRQEDGDLLEASQVVLEKITQGALREDFTTDIPQLINDALLPLPSGAPPLPGVDETMRVFGRVARMSISFNDLTAKGAEIFDSPTIKSIRLVGVVGGVGSVLLALVQVGLRLFGVL